MAAADVKPNANKAILGTAPGFCCTGSSQHVFYQLEDQWVCWNTPGDWSGGGQTRAAG